MKYLVTEKIELGQMQYPFDLATRVLKFMDVLGVDESKLSVTNENGKKFDRLDLKKRAEQEDSLHA